MDLFISLLNNVPFAWDLACSKAFDTLKSHLVYSSILAYFCFNQEAEPFILQTDASAIGLGAVLEPTVSQ